jgi:hypothetical protein
MGKGRPERHDVDYFPFFAKRGKTLNILQSKYGLEGIGFFTNIMRFLALTPDHHYCIKDEIDKMNFFAEIGIQDESRGLEMIELMVKTEKLDRELWEGHKVIASQAFLESLEPAYEKRNNKVITIDEIRSKFIKGGRSPLSDPGNPARSDFDGVSGVGNTQSKVNKSKVNGGGKIYLPDFPEKPDVFQAEKNQPPPPPQILELIISESQRFGFIIDTEKAIEFYRSGIDLSWYTGPYSFLALAAERVAERYKDKTKGERQSLFNDAVLSWQNLRTEYPLWLENREQKAAEKISREALKKAEAAKNAEIQKAKDAVPKECECGGRLDDMLCCLKCEHIYTFDEDAMKYQRRKMNTFLLNHAKKKHTQKQAAGPPYNDIDF